jgi:hypothetical protein
MPAVFPQMDDDRVCSGFFAHARSLDRIGPHAAAQLPNACNMVDINTKFYHSNFALFEVADFLAYIKPGHDGKNKRYDFKPRMVGKPVLNAIVQGDLFFCHL